MARYRKLGVIAGGGALPVRIAAEKRARGEPCFVVRLAGFADESLAAHPGEACAIGEAGKLIRLLKEAGCDAATFAGVVKRPNFASLKTDWRGAALLPKLVAAAARGDGALLSVLVETLEAEGFLIVGAEEAVRDLAAPPGQMGACAPIEGDFQDMAKAARLIDALGAFDVGQAAVVASGLVLAVEAAEGTDAMLDRCALLPAEIRGGVLVKRPKPGQERRIDLPTIGVETIRRAAAAGLKGVAVEAGGALVLDRDAAIAEADRLGLFIYGFAAEEVRVP